MQKSSKAMGSGRRASSRAATEVRSLVGTRGREEEGGDMGGWEEPGMVSHRERWDVQDASREARRCFFRGSGGGSSSYSKICVMGRLTTRNGTKSFPK